MYDISAKKTNNFLKSVFSQLKKTMGIFSFESQLLNCNSRKDNVRWLFRTINKSNRSTQTKAKIAYNKIVPFGK